MKATFQLVIALLTGSVFAWSAVAQDTPSDPPSIPLPPDTTETMPADHDMGLPGTSSDEQVHTVEFVLNEAPDDHPVRLVGQLTAMLEDEHYTFLDDTGSIPVRIDDDVFSPDLFVEGIEVEIAGEVDKDRGEQTIVEVESFSVVE